MAIVTGAASGMGRATAHLFADEGAHVAALDVPLPVSRRQWPTVKAAFAGEGRGHD